MDCNCCVACLADTPRTAEPSSGVRREKGGPLGRQQPQTHCSIHLACVSFILCLVSDSNTLQTRIPTNTLRFGKRSRGWNGWDKGGIAVTLHLCHRSAGGVRWTLNADTGKQCVWSDAVTVLL